MDQKGEMKEIALVSGRLITCKVELEKMAENTF